LGWRWTRRVGEQSTSLGGIFSAGWVGEQTVMADAMKAIGQDVKQKAPDELVRIERHDAVAGLALAPVVLPFESDTVAIEGDEARIGDGDAMGIAPRAPKPKGVSASRTSSMSPMAMSIFVPPVSG
jgi:hypothetical protein